MQTGYTVYAYSEQLHQEIRQFNLHDMTPQSNEQLAQRMAESFAQQLNTNHHMHTQDWTAKIKLETVGIETLPGYISR